MSFSGISEPEKHRLLCTWQAEQLTPEEAARLWAAAQADDDLCREMATLQTIERLLRHQGVLAVDGDLFAAEVVARLREQTEPHKGFASAVIRRLQRAHPHRWSLPWLKSLARGQAVWSTAVAVLVGIALVVAWQQSARPAVATIVGLEAVQWGTGQSALSPGQPIPRGSIEIESGFLSLQFSSQAKVILEGRASLELLGPNAARLRRGKVVAHVPKSAQGFVLESPEGRIIDLGTRFGVEVNDEGGTEVHVLQGLVRTAIRGEANMRELHASQGLRMTPGNVVAIEADQSRFLTALPPRSTKPLGYVHWSLDEGQGDLLHDTGIGLGSGEASARRTSYHSGRPGPTWVPGRFGSALEFDGIDQYVATEFRGIAGAQARTVACWVRVPRDWDPANAYAMVSWGSMKPGEAWQISVNPEAKDGPVGRLRAGVSKGPVVGTRDLRDGQWHHIAVVLYDGTTPRDTTHILLYVDGQLEPAYRKSVHEVQTRVEHPDASNVLLGRDLSQSAQHVFRGTLDEVYIVDAALSQETIQRLMHMNRLGYQEKPHR